MSSFRQNYIPAPADVPREPTRTPIMFLLAFAGVLWAWGTYDDGSEQRRLTQLRLDAFRAGYAAAQETTCRAATEPRP